MIKLILDFNTLDTKEKFYSFISEQLDFPEHFGNNADALNDCISEINDTTEVTLVNSSTAGEWSKPIFAVLRDIENVICNTQLDISTMKRSDFYYDLPEELIAQTPVEPRNH